MALESLPSSLRFLLYFVCFLPVKSPSFMLSRSFTMATIGLEISFPTKSANATARTTNRRMAMKMFRFMLSSPSVTSLVGATMATTAPVERVEYAT